MHGLASMFRLWESSGIGEQEDGRLNLIVPSLRWCKRRWAYLPHLIHVAVILATRASSVVTQRRRMLRSLWRNSYASGCSYVWEGYPSVIPGWPVGVGARSHYRITLAIDSYFTDFMKYLVFKRGESPVVSGASAERIATHLLPFTL